jgi:hypothetical protein
MYLSLDISLPLSLSLHTILDKYAGSDRHSCLTTSPSRTNPTDLGLSANAGDQLLDMVEPSSHMGVTWCNHVENQFH